MERSARKRLFIIGAGGFGREVFTWAEQTWGFDEEWSFGGFLDDNPAALDGFDYPGDVVGTVAGFVPGENDRFLCAVGKPSMKEKLAGFLLAKGARFATLVHPTVVCGRNVEIGEGCILCPRVVLTSDIRLGRFVSLNVATAVGHDVVIGDWTQSSSFCDLTGFTRYGAGVFLGSRASILPHVRVGKDAVIGAGSVVVRDVPPGETVFGAPAGPLRTR